MTIELKKKYDNEEFHTENGHKLSAWEQVAKRQIKRFYEDEEFQKYIATQVLKNDDNPPGPFTRFLYWFGSSCKGCGWGVMIDFSERNQRVFLVDRYYKIMHKWRDEIMDITSNNTHP